jgi:hypothetical protein
MPNCYKKLEKIANVPAILNPQLTGNKVTDNLKLKSQAEFLKEYPDKKVPVDPVEWLTTPGGKVIQRWNRSRESTTLAEFQNDFCTVFHAADGWTWFGGSKCPVAYEILDGDKMEGECQALARAFRTLATCGNGMGLTFSTNDVANPVTYKGRNEKGFISNHPADGILNLPPNVFLPGDRMPDHSTKLSPLYCWGNHKVVPYGNKFYDPSYWTTYDHLEDMAVYHIVFDENPGAKDVMLKIATSTGGSMFLIEFSDKRSMYLRPKLAKPPLYMGPYAEEDKAKAALAQVVKQVI